MSSSWLQDFLDCEYLLPNHVLGQSGGATLIQILTHYQSTEELSSEALLEQQLMLLESLATHSGENSRYFKERLKAAKLRPSKLVKPGGLQKLPVMTRQDLIQAGDSLFCKNVPEAHGTLGVSSTSGSTGEVVKTRKTQLCLQHGMAGSLREILWHKRDPRGKSAVIRANIPEPINNPSWGPPPNTVLRCGPEQIRSSSDSLESLTDWLLEFQPNQILLYPSILNELLNVLQERGASLPELKVVRTFAESVSPDLREKTKNFFGFDITDIYSSEEFALLATQCPEEGNYHISETALIEVLDESDRPCKEGEVGRVIVTDLINYATPLIRYDIRDRAVMGPRNCPCGRSSPTLKRILGRERNLVTLPDGSKHWPLVGFTKFLKILPILQFQLVQESLTTVIAKFYTKSPNPEAHELAIASIVQEALGYPFNIRFEWSKGPLSRGKNDKFEEFIGLVK